MKAKKLIIATCFIVSGCFSKTSMMTQETYSNIQTGTPVKKLVEENGRPYSVETKNGMEEYKYVERVTSGNYLIYENHFTLFVKNGVVVAKTATQEKTPAYDMIYQDDPNHNNYP